MNDKNLEHLQYLDTILNYLKNGVNSSYTFLELFNLLEAGNITFDSTLETEFKDTSDGTIHITGLNIEGFRRQVFDEAIFYLKDLGLISLSVAITSLDNKVITLSYKGRIKLTNSFVNEYKKDQADIELRKNHINDTRTVARIQKITLPLAVIVAIIAILVSKCDKPTSSKMGVQKDNSCTICHK